MCLTNLFSAKSQEVWVNFILTSRILTYSWKYETLSKPIPRRKYALKIDSLKYTPTTQFCDIIAGVYLGAGCFGKFPGEKFRPFN